jgi:hypothetical protein
MIMATSSDFTFTTAAALAERATLWNGGAGIEYPLGGTLETGLVSFWNANEASGNMIDSKGTYPLIPGVAPSSAAGKINGARGFDGTQVLGASSATGLSPGTGSFTISAWVYFTDLSSTYTFISKTQGGSGTGDEYIIQCATGGPIQFVIYNGSYVVLNSTAPALAAGTWYFVVASRDAAAGTINLQINNGTVDSVACAAPTANPLAIFYAGVFQGNAQFLKGRIDAAGYWNRLLT